MNQADMHGAIRGLYEGILEPGAWQRSLQTLVDTGGGTHGAMIVRDVRLDQLKLAELVNPVFEMHTAYDDHYQAIDPGRHFAATLEPGDWYIDARDFGVRAMSRHPFYQDFFRPFSLCSYAACLVNRTPDYEVFFSMQRGDHQPMFSADDTRSLDWAMPHIRGAVAMRERTKALSTMAQLSARLLERLQFGVLAMTAERRVLFANGIGERWARRLSPAGKSDGLALSRPFDEMLRAACDGTRPVTARAAIARDAGGVVAQVIVLPLPAAHPLADDWQQPAALVVIHEMHQAPPQLADVLRDLYGLTPAEIRLACLLASGMGLPEACEHLHVRRETARTQLKSVFLKIGVGTQAQLAHLLTRIAAVRTDE